MDKNRVAAAYPSFQVSFKICDIANSAPKNKNNKTNNNMPTIKITSDNNGRLTTASHHQLRSFFTSICGPFAKQLEATALPHVESTIQRHMSAHSAPTTFMRISDFPAQPSRSMKFMSICDYRPPVSGIEMIPVRSSSLRCVGYNPVNGTLRIEFQSGGIWDYFHVSPQEHQRLFHADSPGGYFRAHICNHFQSRKIQ